MAVRMVVGMPVLMILVMLVIIMAVIVAMLVIVIVLVLVSMRVRTCGFGWLACGGQDIDFCGVDAAAVHAAHIEMNAEVKGVDGLLKNRDGNAGVDERGKKHVSADAGEAVEIGDLHHVVSDALGAGSWLFQPMVETGSRVFIDPLRKPSRSSVTNL